MLKKIKNEHYIPQVYLKSFCQNNKCYVYDKQNNHYYSTNCENIMAQRYLYDLSDELLEVCPNPNFDPQTLEKILADKVDSFWSEIVKYINTDCTSFWTTYYYDIYKNIAIQILRTPKGKNLLSALYGQIYNKNESILEQFSTVFLGYEIVKIIDQKSLLLDWLLETYNHISIGINETDCPFITSDNPVVCLPDWVFLPVTPNRCIFLSKKKSCPDQFDIAVNECLKSTEAESLISLVKNIINTKNKKEKELKEKLNPLSIQLTRKEIQSFNFICYNKAERFIVANTSMQDQKLWDIQ